MKTALPVPATGIHLQGFAPVPNWLLRRREVNDGTKLVFGRLCQYCGGERTCFPKQATLAAELGKSERTIRDHLAELEKHGLIRRVQRGFARSNVYELLAHPWHLEGGPSPGGSPSVIPAEISSLAAESCRSGPANSRRRDRRDSAGPLDEKNTEENTEEKRHTHAVGSSALVSPSFEEARTVGEMQGFPTQAVEKWHAEMEAVGWINKHGQPLRDWRAALRSYVVSWRAVDSKARRPVPTQPAANRRPEARLIKEPLTPKMIQV